MSLQQTHAQTDSILLRPAPFYYTGSCDIKRPFGPGSDDIYFMTNIKRGLHPMM